MKSWMERFNGEIRKTIDWLRFSRYTDLKQTRQYCWKLIQLGKELHDPALIGFAYYYLGEILFFEIDFVGSLKYAKTALAYLKHSDAPIMLMNDYELLGCLYVANESYESAFDCFNRAIDLSQKYHQTYIEGVAYGHTGMIYYILGDYARCIARLEKANEIIQQDLSDQERLHRYLQNLTTIVSSQLRLKQTELVEEGIAKIEELIQKSANPEDEMSGLYLLKIEHGQAYGLEDEIEENLYRYIEHYRKGDRKAEEVLPLALSVVEIYKNGKQEWIEQLNPIVDELLASDIAYSQKIELLTAKWSRSEDVSEKEAIMSQCFALYRVQAEQKNQTRLSAIEDLIVRHEENQKIDEWMEMANQDALTGLSNRRYLRQLYGEKVKKAVEEGSSLAVGVIDIDYFKQYNDRYGHLAGDQVLQDLSGVMKDMLDQNLFFARYGGDEFIVVSSGMKKEILEGKLLELRAKLAQLSIPHDQGGKNDCLTVSMGVAYHETVEDETPLEEILQEADKLLYEVKENERSGIKIGEMYE